MIWKWMIVIIVAAFCTRACYYSDAWQERLREERAREEQDKIPRVIAESGDGCKVYVYYIHWEPHYFTRCPNSITTTDRSYDVNCGKGCSRTETESIVSESNVD